MKRYFFYLFGLSLVLFSFHQLYAQVNAGNPTTTNPTLSTTPPVTGAQTPTPPIALPVAPSSTPTTQQPNNTNATPSTTETPKLPDLQQRIYSLQGQLSDLNVYLSNLQIQLSELTNSNSGNGQDLQDRQQKVQDLQNKLMETDTKLKSAKEELDNLSKEIQDIKTANPFEKDSSANIPQSLDRLEKRVSHIEKEIKDILDMDPKSAAIDNSNTQKKLQDHLAPELQSGEASIESKNEAIKVKLNGNILFQEGEVSVSPKGKDVLSKLVPILKNLKDKIVVIIGHSDVVPIGPNLRDFYPTNWELSATRGVMVVRYLESQGVPSSILVAAGRSFYEPSGDGLDRRAEIWIFPKLLSHSQNLDSVS